MSQQQVVAALKRLNPHPEAWALRRVNQDTGKVSFIHIFEPPDDETYHRHARGAIMIGGVAATPEDTTTVVGLDVDAHTSDQLPEEATVAFVTQAIALEVPVVVHRSKSGKGYHVRTLFKEAVSSWVARCIYLAIIATACLEHHKAIDKVWPPRTGTGILALPYNARAVRETGGTLAVDPLTLEPLAKDWQVPAITDFPEMDASDCEAFLNNVGLCTEAERKLFAGCPQEDFQHRSKDGSDGGVQHMMEKCVAAQRMQTEAESLSYEFWFSMMTNFKPFQGGRELFDALSQLDPKRYREANIEGHWKSIRGGPRMCDNLDPGWTCPSRNVCPAKAPAGLPFALKRMGRAY